MYLTQQEKEQIKKEKEEHERYLEARYEIEERERQEKKGKERRKKEREKQEEQEALENKRYWDEYDKEISDKKRKAQYDFEQREKDRLAREPYKDKRELTGEEAWQVTLMQKRKTKQLGDKMLKREAEKHEAFKESERIRRGLPKQEKETEKTNSYRQKWIDALNGKRIKGD